LEGALFFDIDAVSDHAASLPHMLPDEAGFAATMDRLGIGNDSGLVVYDSAGLVGAARVWWMLRAFGHREVAILDGGLPKWLAEGRPVTAAVPTPAPVSRPYEAHLQPALVRNRDQILANLDSRREQVLDARTVERFAGTAPEPWPGRRSGHIPNSLNLPYALLTDPATGTVLPKEALERRFREAEVATNKPVVTSCGSGITACVLAFGLYLTGREDIAVYDGSWAEWGLPGATPVMTGRG
jgi:thiosulfate/3-mercaptopyruvate sulfurtransferase